MSGTSSQGCLAFLLIVLSFSEFQVMVWERGLENIFRSCGAGHCWATFSISQRELEAFVRGAAVRSPRRFWFETWARHSGGVGEDVFELWSTLPFLHVSWESGRWSRKRHSGWHSERYARGSHSGAGWRLSAVGVRESSAEGQTKQAWRTTTKHGSSTKEGVRLCTAIAHMPWGLSARDSDQVYMVPHLSMNFMVPTYLSRGGPETKANHDGLQRSRQMLFWCKLVVYIVHN